MVLTNLLITAFLPCPHVMTVHASSLQYIKFLWSNAHNRKHIRMHTPLKAVRGPSSDLRSVMVRVQIREMLGVSPCNLRVRVTKEKADIVLMPYQLKGVMRGSPRYFVMCPSCVNVSLRRVSVGGNSTAHVSAGGYALHTIRSILYREVLAAWRAADYLARAASPETPDGSRILAVGSEW